jgi:hypothetical protein
MQKHRILIFVLVSSRARTPGTTSIAMIMATAAVTRALRPVAIFSTRRMFIIVGIVIECLKVVVVGLEISQLVLLDQVRLLFIQSGGEKWEQVVG